VAIPRRKPDESAAVVPPKGAASAAPYFCLSTFIAPKKRMLEYGFMELLDEIKSGRTDLVFEYLAQGEFRGGVR
jgi:hypothetical protein